MEPKASSEKEREMKRYCVSWDVKNDKLRALFCRTLCELYNHLPSSQPRMTWPAVLKKEEEKQ